MTKYVIFDNLQYWNKPIVWSLSDDASQAIIVACCGRSRWSQPSFYWSDRHDNPLSQAHLVTLSKNILSTTKKNISIEYIDISDINIKSKFSNLPPFQRATGLIRNYQELIKHAAYQPRTVELGRDFDLDIQKPIKAKTYTHPPLKKRIQNSSQITTTTTPTLITQSTVHVTPLPPTNPYLIYSEFVLLRWSDAGEGNIKSTAPLSLRDFESTLSTIINTIFNKKDILTQAESGITFEQIINVTLNKSTDGVIVVPKAAMDKCFHLMGHSLQGQTLTTNNSSATTSTSHTPRPLTTPQNTTPPTNVETTSRNIADPSINNLQMLEDALHARFLVRPVVLNLFLKITGMRGIWVPTLPTKAKYFPAMNPPEDIQQTINTILDRITNLGIAQAEKDYLIGLINSHKANIQQDIHSSALELALSDLYKIYFPEQIVAYINQSRNTPVNIPPTASPTPNQAQLTRTMTQPNTALTQPIPQQSADYLTSEVKSYYQQEINDTYMPSFIEDLALDKNELLDLLNDLKSSEQTTTSIKEKFLLPRFEKVFKAYKDKHKDAKTLTSQIEPLKIELVKELAKLFKLEILGNPRSVTNPLEELIKLNISKEEIIEFFRETLAPGTSINSAAQSIDKIKQFTRGTHDKGVTKLHADTTNSTALRAFACGELSEKIKEIDNAIKEELAIRIAEKMRAEHRKQEEAKPDTIDEKTRKHEERLSTLEESVKQLHQSQQEVITMLSMIQQQLSNISSLATIRTPSGITNLSTEYSKNKPTGQDHYQDSNLSEEEALSLTFLRSNQLDNYYDDSSCIPSELSIPYTEKNYGRSSPEQIQTLVRTSPFFIQAKENMSTKRNAPSAPQQAALTEDEAFALAIELSSQEPSSFPQKRKIDDLSAENKQLSPTQIMSSTNYLKKFKIGADKPESSSTDFTTKVRKP